MSQWSKLIQRIYSLAKDLRFDEIRKVLEKCGYVMDSPSGGSSHFIFRKPGCMPITVPKHEPIKKCYVKIIRAAVMESETEKEDIDDDK